MQPTEKRKFAWIVAVVAVLFFAPALINLARQAISSLSSPPAVSPKPSAARYATPQLIPTVPIQPASPFTPLPVADVSAIQGIWQAGAVIPERGLCKLSLEVRQQSPLPPQRMVGYSSMTCIPMKIAAGGDKQEALRLLTQGGLAPVSHVLTGTPGLGGVDFTVDPSITAPQLGCNLQSFHVSAFGTDQVVASWHESGCAGGQMVMRRVAR